MKYYIVVNKDFPEWVSGIKPFIETTEFEDKAYYFSDYDKAEEIRLQVQENTGNRWRVYEITEDKQV